MQQQLSHAKDSGSACVHDDFRLSGILAVLYEQVPCQQSPECGKCIVFGLWFEFSVQACSISAILKLRTLRERGDDFLALC